ncbi:GNAT family N-acetyltransferase [Haloechinothrix sp. LS1_15]|uniref:GNAT family N-acetyltransferase n=1 Tax=Haloechinothrix sp. LS1_15 TaxID=2652248 RepID=UPI002945B80C|nr:GNAT family N-acetyltransferase [Haloechinothrix sp. LS1_15]MDV6012151.1 GNAT family N-acetyltransferase [Haloechinothrix sp. LS1_15]
MARVAVHLAAPDDASAIARIQRDTWRFAYQEVLDQAALEALDSGDVEREWREAIGHPETDVFVATEGGHTVGFSVSGPAPEEELAGPRGELPEDSVHIGLIATALVEPRWQRRGHGGRLIAAAARALRSRGANRGMTWVAESDSATLSFYRDIGWHPDGTVRTLDTGGVTLREMRLFGTLELRVTEPAHGAS